ncbi:hypothetical protein WR25_14871 isoform A [Diploscapter pachys]|uniref:Mitochondrial carrier protein n=1 Tax=Diploscapter pachys TaxID=2018661 RepID=A0A2A2KN28_9BILA|nr:hypothetical protein WR25_14871 isoform A [Diploscapter pachys]
MMLPFLTTGALHSLLFTGYGIGLKILHPGESNVQARKDLPMREILLASICGTMAQLGPAIPIELVKTRLQVQRESAKLATEPGKQLYLGTMDCIKQTIKNEGVRGLFKGGQVLFLRDSIGYLFYIPVYEGSLRILRKTNFSETPIQLLSGGLAGIGGWLSICPLEVIKNRIQVDKTGHTRFSEIEVFF